MKISNIKEKARAALTGKWGKGALMVLAYFAVFIIAGMVIGLLGGDETLMGTILDLAVTIVQVPIALGLIFAFIKLKRNEEVKAFDYLKLGFANFVRTWKISLRVALKTILPLVLLVISIILMSVGIFFSVTFSGVMFGFGAVAALPEILLSRHTGGLVLTGLIMFFVASIWLVARSLLYSLSWYIAYDNPNMTTKEVINESARMMKGNRVKIFLLDLSFIGWAILGIFTLGIGYIWLAPYMQVSTICFYEYLLGKNEDKNNKNDVEVIQEV